ncbi:MAG: hypothetical protein WBR29_11120 [Gammaproteobacteria bacterium]
MKISKQATATFVKETRRPPALSRERIVSANVHSRRAQRSPVRLKQLLDRRVL